MQKIDIKHHRQKIDIDRDDIERQTLDYLSRGGRIEVLPSPENNPYLETPRRPHPEQRKKTAQPCRRAGNVPPPEGMLTRTEVMEALGIGDGFNGSRYVDTAVADGRMPPPDEVISTTGGKQYYFWLPDSLMPYTAEARVAQLHEIVARHL